MPPAPTGGNASEATRRLLRVAASTLTSADIGDLEALLYQRAALQAELARWERGARGRPGSERRLVSKALDEPAEATRRRVRDAVCEDGDRFVGDALIVGRSGAGKSSLVNAVVGRDVAVVGAGAAVTTQVTRYMSPNGAVIDTPGLEVGHAADLRSLTQLARLADVVWFCVPAEQGRLQDEVGLLRQIEASTPVLVVATRVLDPASRFDWLQEAVGQVPVVVMARPREIRGANFPAHGKDSLVRLTAARIRDAV